MKIVLYGSGNRCRILLDLLRKSKIEVVCVVDSNPQRCGEMISNYIIEPLGVLSNYTDIYVCVTFYSSKLIEPVWKELQELGFKNEKILSFHELLFFMYKNWILIEKRSETNIRNTRKIIFDGSWQMRLGGVESWLRMIVPALNQEWKRKVYLATEGSMAQLDLEYSIDFCLYNTPNFSETYVKKCIGFIMMQLPCILVFSRVDELLLSAALVKKENANNLKIVMVVHGSCDGMYKDVLAYKDYIDYYMCVCSGIKSQLIEQGVCRKKIEMMTCPVHFEESLVRSYTYDRNMPLQIGFAGRLECFEKRIDVLQEVIITLEQKKVNYVMNIAGSGSYQDNLKLFVEKNGWNKRVRLLGQLPNNMMSEFWRKQDIALNTSDNEGRPLSNMEAMLNGAVPIVTRTIGILDDVKDDYNGYIVPLNDAERMADRIYYLDKNRRLLEEFGTRARNDMRAKTDLRAHVRQWINVLKKWSE